MSKASGSILITGGTTGLGYHAAIAVAKARPDCAIVIASRSNTDDAAAKISKASGHKNISFMSLDLSSMAKVRAFAKEWERQNLPPIQTLFFNAGLQFPGKVQTNEDGIEKTFAINHVGHALLFHLLTKHLAADARIIITASGTHDPAQKTMVPDAKYEDAESLAHPDPATVTADGRQHYANSKLANVLWSYALQRRVQTNNKKWTVAAFDPGLMPGTGLARDYSPFLRFVWNFVMPRIIFILRRVIAENVHTPQESGSALAWLGTSADPAKVDGKYFEGRKEIPSSVESYKVEKQDDLFEWTVNRVAADPDEVSKFSTLSS